MLLGFFSMNKSVDCNCTTVEILMDLFENVRKLDGEAKVFFFCLLLLLLLLLL